jgi:hypothetical protein
LVNLEASGWSITYKHNAFTRNITITSMLRLPDHNNLLIAILFFLNGSPLQQWWQPLHRNEVLSPNAPHVVQIMGGIIFWHVRLGAVVGLVKLNSAGKALAAGRWVPTPSLLYTGHVVLICVQDL